MTPPLSLLTTPIFGHAATRAHFSDGALVEAMIQVEIALAEVQAELGLIPPEAARAIAALAQTDRPATAPLAQGVQDAGVPVPALLAALRDRLPPQAADWLHYGATSQDIVDTAFCLCAQAALRDLAHALGALIDTLETLCRAHAQTAMLARTRGQLATPISFGLRVAQWAQPLIAREAELATLCTDALRVQLGGGAGSRSAFGARGPDVARHLADALDLRDHPPWHTDRSGLRRLADWLTQIVTATAKIGRDVAVATRGEVAELRLATTGGSSTMPHKSNPVAAEALQSLALIAAACEAGLAASAVHGEDRDGAQWPVEWMLLPLLFETTGAALARATALLDDLEVDAAAMAARITADPAVKAEAAIFALAPHLGRAEAARIVGDALTSGAPFPDALPCPDGLDWSETLADAAFTASAAETAAQIFAGRHKP